MTGFFSEKTSEIYLVPEFLKILSELGNVTALSFTRQREDTIISHQLNEKKIVKLVALFSRRPKIDINNSSLIHYKINQELIDYANYVKDYPVPIFCGISLANNVFELPISDSLWFNINQFKYEESFYYDLSEKNDLFCLSLGKKQIYKIINETAQEMTWSVAIDTMNKFTKKEGNQYSHLPWLYRGWRIKPIFFIIECKKK